MAAVLARCFRRVVAEEDGVEDRPPPRRLEMFAVAFLTFMTVCGGPFGIETAVAAAGPFPTLLGILFLALFWGVPQALMTAELSTVYDENGGYITWVADGLGPFWGFVNGFNALLCNTFDLPIYPVLFADYVIQFVSGGAAADSVFSADDDGSAASFSSASSSAAWPHPHTHGNGSVLPGVGGYWNHSLSDGMNGINGANGSSVSPLSGDDDLVPTLSTGLVVFSWVLKGGALLLIMGLNVLGLEVVAVSTMVFTGLIVAPFFIQPAMVTMVPSAWLAVSPDIHWPLFVASLLWSMQGWDSMGCIAGEVEHGGKHYVVGLLLALGLIVLTYSVPVLVGVSIEPALEAWNEGYFSTVASRIAPWLGVWVVVAASLAVLGEFNAEMSASSRALQRMAHYRMMPAWLRHNWDRFDTPVPAILVQGSIVAFMMTFNFEELVVLTTLFNNVSMVLEIAAFVHLKHTRPDMPRPFAVPWGTRGAWCIAIPKFCVIGYAIATLHVDWQLWVGLSANILIFAAAVWFAHMHPEPPAGFAPVQNHAGDDEDEGEGEGEGEEEDEDDVDENEVADVRAVTGADRKGGRKGGEEGDWDDDESGGGGASENDDGGEEEEDGEDEEEEEKWKDGEAEDERAMLKETASRRSRSGRKPGSQQSKRGGSLGGSRSGTSGAGGGGGAAGASESGAWSSSLTSSSSPSSSSSSAPIVITLDSSSTTTAGSRTTIRRGAAGAVEGERVPRGRRRGAGDRDGGGGGAVRSVARTTSGHVRRGASGRARPSATASPHASSSSSSSPSSSSSSSSTSSSSVAVAPFFASTASAAHHHRLHTEEGGTALPGLVHLPPPTRTEIPVGEETVEWEVDVSVFEPSPLTVTPETQAFIDATLKRGTTNGDESS